MVFCVQRDAQAKLGLAVLNAGARSEGDLVSSLGTDATWGASPGPLSQGTRLWARPCWKGCVRTWQPQPRTPTGPAWPPAGCYRPRTDIAHWLRGVSPTCSWRRQEAEQTSNRQVWESRPGSEILAEDSGCQSGQCSPVPLGHPLHCLLPSLGAVAPSRRGASPCRPDGPAR